jgi:hypothetical protein
MEFLAQVPLFGGMNIILLTAFIESYILPVLPDAMYFYKIFIIQENDDLHRTLQKAKRVCILIPVEC